MTYQGSSGIRKLEDLCGTWPGACAKFARSGQCALPVPVPGETITGINDWITSMSSTSHGHALWGVPPRQLSITVCCACKWVKISAPLYKVSAADLRRVMNAWLVKMFLRVVGSTRSNPANANTRGSWQSFVYMAIDILGMLITTMSARNRTRRDT